MTPSPPPTPVRRLLIAAGLVSRDDAETGKIVRGRLTTFTLGITLLYLIAAVAFWVGYAMGGTHVGLLLPIVWSIGAVMLVAASIRRARVKETSS
jgi:hypothetical protein